MDTVDFKNITDFVGEFEADELDGESVEQLIDFMYDDTAGIVRYLVNFSVGEIQFQTNATPVVFFARS